MHEVGHLLGMFHDFIDGSFNCGDFENEPCPRFCTADEEINCTDQMGYMHYLPVTCYLVLYFMNFIVTFDIFSTKMNGLVVLNMISRPSISILF